MQERSEMHGVEPYLKEQWIGVLVDIVSFVHVHSFLSFFYYIVDMQCYACECTISFGRISM